MIKPDITFALVKTFYRHGKNHFKSFLPLVADCAQSLTGEYVATGDVQRLYKEKFGLDLPQSVIRKIMLTGKEGEYFSFEGELIKKGPKLASSTIRSEQSKIVQEHESVISGFIQFAQQNRSVIITTEQAELAMYSFMDENIYKIIKNSANHTKEDIPLSGSEHRVLFGRFLRNAIDTGNTTIGEYIADIAKGLMIQNAVYLPSIETIERRFVGTTLLLDTPLVLSLLGYAGPERRTPILELVEMAQSSGARVSVYEFTVGEVGGVLQACADRIKNGSRSTQGKTIEFFIEQRYSYEEVLVFKGRIGRDLKKLNLDVLPKPEYVPVHSLDEKELEKNIDAHLSYRYESSKRRDIDAISATFRLRKGRNALNLEDCSSIFVTSNFELVMATKDYFKKDRQHVDIAMTDFYITNILWLKKPTKFPDLPSKRIIADIYASLQPTDAMWNMFLSEAGSMSDRGEITYDDVIVLRTSTQSPDLLVDASHAGMSTISPSTVQEILETINSRKQEEFIAKQDKRLMDRATIFAEFLAGVVSWLLLALLIAVSVAQVFDPLKLVFVANLNYVFIAGSILGVILSIFNIAVGTTLNVAKRTFVEFMKPKLFRMLKALTA